MESLRCVLIATRIVKAASFPTGTVKFSGISDHATVTAVLLESGVSVTRFNPSATKKGLQKFNFVIG